MVRKGYRRRGITYALAEAAVGYARANGARALEGYAMLTQPGREITWGELHVGARQVFAEAGLAEVSRPSVRRAVMRIDFDGAARHRRGRRGRLEQHVDLAHGLVQVPGAAPAAREHRAVAGPERRGFPPSGVTVSDPDSR